VIIADISSNHVLEFCRGISAEAVFYVSIQPRPGCETGNCFNNLDAVVAEHGGRSIYGWSIVEWPGMFLEAEQHAVWHQPDGTHVDPTPPQQRFSQVAFLPDPSLDEWEFRPNVKRALQPDRSIQEFLDATTQVQREMRRNGCVPAPLARRVRALQRRLTERYGTSSGA
jgi:hypothetical protein